MNLHVGEAFWEKSERFGDEVLIIQLLMLYCSYYRDDMCQQQWNEFQSMANSLDNSLEQNTACSLSAHGLIMQKNQVKRNRLGVQLAPPERAINLADNSNHCDLHI